MHRTVYDVVIGLADSTRPNAWARGGRRDVAVPYSLARAAAKLRFHFEPGGNRRRENTLGGLL